MQLTTAISRSTRLPPLALIDSLHGGLGDDMDLQSLADTAFDAIKENTGLEFPHGTVEEAYESFQSITKLHGLAWLIDSTTGTGMSHLGWTQWMSEARDQLGGADPSVDRIVLLLEKIAKSEAYKGGAWRRVIEAARNYARLKAFGHYIDEKGHRIIPCGTDTERQVEYFRDLMCRESVMALSGDAMPLE